MKRAIFLLHLSLLLLLAACNKDGVITTTPQPVIKVEGSGVYELKVGGELTLSPSVENGEGAVWQWTLDGREVGNGKSYRFRAERVGIFYLSLRVENESGADEADFRLEVIESRPLAVAISAEEGGELELLQSARYEMLSSVAKSEDGDVEYEWLLSGKVVGREPSYSVQIDQTGEYPLTLRVSCDGDSAEASTLLRVVARREPKVFFAPQNISATEPQKASVALGRELHLKPMTENFSSPTFAWSIDGEATEGAEVLKFAPTAKGLYTIEVVVTDSDGGSASASIEVECCDEEGTFRRAATAESRSECNKVFDYTPAPGQFINESKSGFATEQSAADAQRYAERRLQAGSYVSLGGWGGYIVVGFDHSIDNGAGADFAVKGNMHEGSSEAGIVWVSQDVNGNGEPDDVWYELRGSEYDSPTSWRDYAVTYYPSVAGQMDVLWSDNRGATGRISRMDSHTQEHYFPQWLGSQSITLYGTRLAHNTSIDSVMGNYVNSPFAWGYADNLGSDTDTGDNLSVWFEIDNAVTAAGLAADLQYIDFVKIQSAINHTAGHLGELSTEVCGVKAL